MRHTWPVAPYQKLPVGHFRLCRHAELLDVIVRNTHFAVCEVFCRTSEILGQGNKFKTADRYLQARCTFYLHKELVGIHKAGPHFSDIVINEEDAVTRSLQNTSFSLDNEIGLIEAEAAIAQAKADRGFSAVLTAQFGLTQTGDDIATSYRNPIDQEIVGLSLSVPIVDWGLGKGRVQMAKTQQEIILTQIEQEIIERRQDIYIRVVQFNAQAKQCDASRKADEIAAERFELALQRFRNGTISILDINTAQNERDEATSQYINELANYWSYYYNLRKDTLYDYIYGKDLDAEFDKIIDN